MKLVLTLILFHLYLFSQAHIFVYHRFGDDRHKSTNIDIKILKKQFDYLKKHNYKVVSIDKIIKKIKNHTPIPNNWVAFTIDDSYKSFYEKGYKVFKEYNFPFTLFVYVKATDKRYGDFMSWKQLEKIKQDPLSTLGLHSYSHPHLAKLTKDDIIKDTLKAKKIFEKHLKIEPKYYAYPYGEYNKEIKNIIKKHFQAIFNQNIGVVTQYSDIYDLNRIALTGNSDIKKKLKYNYFNVKWIEPKEYPKDAILKKIVALVDKKEKFVKIFISGYGWRKVKVVDGKIDYYFGKRLVFKRSRIVIGKTPYKISTKLLMGD